MKPKKKITKDNENGDRKPARSMKQMFRCRCGELLMDESDWHKCLGGFHGGIQ